LAFVLILLLNATWQLTLVTHPSPLAGLLPFDVRVVHFRQPFEKYIAGIRIKKDFAAAHAADIGYLKRESVAGQDLLGKDQVLFSNRDCFPFVDVPREHVGPVEASDLNLAPSDAAGRITLPSA
jgi:hypothetical protein